MPALLSFMDRGVLFFSFLFQEADQHKYPGDAFGRNNPYIQGLEIVTTSKSVIPAALLSGNPGFS
jgi:hypothetical protein